MFEKKMVNFKTESVATFTGIYTFIKTLQLIKKLENIKDQASFLISIVSNNEKMLLVEDERIKSILHDFISDTE